MHFPEYGEDYFQSLTGERCIEKLSKTGRTKWIWEKLRPNEALDCRAYATAAAYFFGLDKFKAEHWITLKSSLGLVPESSNETGRGEMFSIVGARL